MGEASKHLLPVLWQNVPLDLARKGTTPLPAALCGGNSDAWHSGHHLIFLNCLANRLLERVEVHVSSLLHNLSHSRLADFKGL